MVTSSFQKRIPFALSVQHAFNGEINQKTRKFWHFSKLEKIIIAAVITAILLVSAFGFLMDAGQNQPGVVDPQSYDPTATASPTPEASASMTPSVTQTPQPWVNPTPAPWVPVAQGPQADPTKGPGLIESNPSMNSSVWSAIAKNAWNYFQPGRGIDSTTGLPASSLGWNHFTDWDLGVYIQAIIDAQKIGLISKDGDWGSHARLEKVITFLETRELLDGGAPFWFYDSNGKGYQKASSIDGVDAGTLLSALHRIKAFDSSFTSRIDNIVYNRVDISSPMNSNNRTNYQSLVEGVRAESVYSKNVYAYYLANGFASFFPQELADAPDNILNNILNAERIATYNATLPKADISCEPLLYSVFNLGNNDKVKTIMDMTYRAHEAKYEATGVFSTFSEGIGSTGFIWEWVVLSSGQTWKVSVGGDSYVDINPVIYNKVSISFLALYNSTFAREMSVYLEKVSPEPSNGYCAGADHNANINLVNVFTGVEGNTNGLILSAARYALRV